MTRRQINSIGRACVALAEQSLHLKMMLPIFGMGPHPDWPLIADMVRDTRRKFDQLAGTLSDIKPVLNEDLQWKLCSRDLPDFNLTVLVSIEGHDDAHEAYRDEDGEDVCWRFSNGHKIESEVYAWTDMPPALLVRQTVRLALPAPKVGAS